LASSRAFKTVSYLGLKSIPNILWSLYTILAAVEYSEAVLGSSQAVLWMQDNFSSAPEVYMMKHMPPLRSAWERLVSSALLAEDPTLKSPKPKMRALRTIRMSKLVKLSVKTSEVEEARANNSEVSSTRGATILLPFCL